MKTIKSFCVDHDVLKKGMYISRIDGDVVTYDLRMVVPNQGPYLENAGLHTFEHLLATYVRNSSWSDAIVYAGGLPHRVLSADAGYHVSCRGIAAGSGGDGVHQRV